MEPIPYYCQWRNLFKRCTHGQLYIIGLLLYNVYSNCLMNSLLQQCQICQYLQGQCAWQEGLSCIIKEGGLYNSELELQKRFSWKLNFVRRKREWYFATILVSKKFSITLPKNTQNKHISFQLEAEPVQWWQACTPAWFTVWTHTYSRHTHTLPHAHMWSSAQQQPATV